jgi:acyl-CoA thioesterase
VSGTSESPSFPLQEFLGFTIVKGDGAGTASLDLDDRHHNPNAVAHGSVAFALMDTAMGAAAVSVIAEDHTCATIEMHTRFHRAAVHGTLTAEAKVLTAGSRVIQLECKTTDDDGRLVASSTGSFAVLQPRPS